MMHIERVLFLAVVASAMTFIGVAGVVRYRCKSDPNRRQFFARVGLVCALVGVLAIAGLYLVAIKKLAIEKEIMATERRNSP
jgi:hypothetical protein